MGFFVEEHRQQRAGLFLRDVHYRIHAWFEFIPLEERRDNRPAAEEHWADATEQAESSRSDEGEAKYAAMFGRRARKGQCFHRPYLGCREFACDFRLIEEGAKVQPPINKTEELGWMLYDVKFEEPTDPKPEFFRACLDHGVVNTDRRDPKLEVRG